MINILIRSVEIFIDVLFLTNIYHKKYKISDYYLIIIIMSSTGFLIRQTINNIFVSIIITTLLSLIFYLTIRDKKAIACFVISMLFLFLFDIVINESFTNDYYFGAVLSSLIKIFLISLSNEFAKLTIIGTMENFTYKALISIFIFINLLNGLYLMTKVV